MTQAEFNAWIRARFNLWTKDDVDAAIKAEREACAKVCESEWGKGYRDDGGDAWLTHDNAVHACAAAIRARGET